MLKSKSTRVILALIGGLAVGIALSAFSPEYATALLPTASLLGTLWLHSLQMPIVPLVFSLIVTGIISTLSAAKGGSFAGRLLGLFAILLTASTIITAFVMGGLPAPFPIPADALAVIRAAQS